MDDHAKQPRRFSAIDNLRGVLAPPGVDLVVIINNVTS